MVTAQSYNNVGSCYFKLGERKKGLKYLTKALEIYEEELGERNVAMASSYNNVGSCYWMLGNQEKAINYIEKAYEIDKELLGERHLETQKILKNLQILKNF